jgi:hypothetical protein
LDDGGGSLRELSGTTAKCPAKPEIRNSKFAAGIPQQERTEIGPKRRHNRGILGKRGNADPDQGQLTTDYGTTAEKQKVESRKKGRDET